MFSSMDMFKVLFFVFKFTGIHCRPSVTLSLCDDDKYDNSDGGDNDETLCLAL